MARIQLTRAELEDVTKAVENTKAFYKRTGKKWDAKVEAQTMRKFARGIAKRRKGGL